MSKMRPLASAVILAGFVLLQPALAHAAGDVPTLIKSIATDLCGTFAAVCVTIGLVGAGAQFFSSGGDMHSIPRILIPWAIAAAIALGATAYVGTLGYGS